MKRQYLLFVSAFLLILTSCNKNSSGNKKKTIGVAKKELELAYIKPSDIKLDEDFKVAYDSMQVFFTPSYESVLPEEPTSISKNRENIENNSGLKSESVIPGVRKLADYKTKYSSERRSVPVSSKEEASEPSTDDNPDDPFVVEDWGPSAGVFAENTKPTFYVIFSKPVRSLKALEEPSETSDVMTVTPAIKGVFRWYGTRHLSFEASEAADPSVKYTIKVNNIIKSIYGQKLTGETKFTTKAEVIKLMTIYGGFIGNSKSAYDYYTGALPPYENRFLLKTNYMLTEEALREELVVKIGNKSVNYKIEADYSDKNYYWSYTTKSNKDLQKSTTFIVTITDSVPHNSIVTAEAKTSKTKFSYKTLLPFNLNSVSKMTDYTSGNKGHPLNINFSQIPDKKTVMGNIHFDFDFDLTENNFEVSGTTLTIYNLPLDYDSEYRLYVGDGIKDVYGQPLADYKTEYVFKTRPKKAYVKYLDYGTKMMEAQYPHKLIFEYQNIQPNGKYTVRKVENPIYWNWRDNWFDGEGDSGYIDVVLKEEDKRQFEEVDLNPYLKNGYGFIKFQSSIPVKEYNYWNEREEIEDKTNILNIQVTDLGISARTGINKAVVMVRSLSTNKPVANAEVLVCKNMDLHDMNPQDRVFARGKTDSNGFAVINYTAEELKEYETRPTDEDEHFSEYPSIMVINGDDKAIFTPSSHNMWRDNVDTSSIMGARNPVQRTFMFVDRGLYKPGETVTFRGIDKDQVLGAFVNHHGKFKLTVKGSWWGSEEIIDPIQSELSESGGFWGSFKLPDDLEPGYYDISYFRDGQNGRYSNATVSFVVANFERVKFEASISIPDLTYYGGDKISAELTADYLAGGALSNANYDVSWYREATSFTSDAPEAHGFMFGTYNYYDSRTYYSDDSGQLSSSGNASISCATEKITSGTPYKYRVEAAVTDVSNQRISTSSSVTVHSSQFYLGLKRSQNGYPKKGTKVEVPFILVGPDGTKLSDSEAKLKVKNLKYTLTREVWTMVNENSVDSSVYTRYERSTKEEGTGTVNIANSGTISFTPSESGWHTLKVTGNDSRDNYVETSYEFYVTGGRAFWFGDDSDSINLTPDQSQYNPGDTAQILLESPLPEGDYLITVEREGIFTEEIKHFDCPANVIEVPIASNYVPVVYVSVSSYSMRTEAPKHKYGEVDLDKPKGYYGVTPLFINPYVRAFSVKIETDKIVYRPGEEVTLTMTATKGGKAVEGAELTVMAVDRGVLDLIDYHVPNPIDYFYNTYHFPLRVKGGDSRDMLMDPVTYSIKDLQGGDAADEEKEDERKDFRPTAVFEPALITGKDGTVTCKFIMPDSLTTYRITAFGVKEDLFALQENEVKVQNPINIQQVQPRKLRVRDTAECGVLITNLDTEGQEVTVSIEARSPTGNTVQDEQEGRITVPGKAFVDGKDKHKVFVAPGQSSVVYFDVAAEEPGTVELVYSIKSDVLNEKLISPIKIEKTYVYETVTMVGSTKDDTISKKKEQIEIPNWIKDGRGDLNITLDATRLGLLGSAVNYVFEYPYGCMEQQSSRVLPLVIFGDYIDVFGLNSQVADIKKCVSSYTQKWGSYQKSSGGFPYWTGSSGCDLYVSVRIAQIYADAIKNGYTDADLGFDIEKLKSYIASTIKAELGDYNNNEYYKRRINFIEHYACYVMGLLGDSRLEYLLDDLYENRKNFTLQENAYLALALISTGKSANVTKAEKLAKEIRGYLQPVERSVTVLKKNLKYQYFWFASDNAEMATILELFVSLKPKDEMVDRLVYTLLMSQSYGYWQNTSTTSSVLHSIYTYIKQRDLDSVKFAGTTSINGKKVMDEMFKGAGAKPKTLTLPFEGDVLAKLPRDSAIPVEFEKNGTGTLYYTVEMKYALPDEMQNSRDEGIGIKYTITDYDTDEVVNSENTKDSLIVLESGKIYKATIKIESSRQRSYLALRAPIPSGAEILDSTFVTTGAVGGSSNGGSYRHWLSNKFIMDNEVQFFWDDFYTGSTTVTYTFRATRRGTYPVPPVQAECMYEPEIFGRGYGYLVQIK